MRSTYERGYAAASGETLVDSLYDRPMLLGRASECARVEAALQAARDGGSAALVLSGEPGIGKSALLEHALSAADGMTVLTARGFASETELAFAALSELFRPVMADVEGLPSTQRAALEGALAIGPPVGAEPLTVCVAALGLVAAAAERAPLLMVIDDAHWLDRPTAEVVCFLAHRMHAEAAALLVAVRPGEGAFAAQGIDALELSGLAESAATDLARSAAQLDAAVARQLAAFTGGNPLAVMELAGSLSSAQRSGVDPLEPPAPAGPGTWAEPLFAGRLAALPADARRALLIAAAAGSDETALIAAALAVEGVPATAFEPAERARLVIAEPDRVQFRHPLVAAAVYQLAEAPDVRSAHASLAQALEGRGRDDERAWHLASAAIEPDASVSAAMADAARSAGGRGGFTTAARAYLRAASLEPDRAARGGLLLDAAQAAQRMGGMALSLECLDMAAGLPLVPDDAARADLLRGRAEARTGSTTRAFALMQAAADRWAETRPDAAALALVESVDPCIRAGRPADALETAHRAAALAASGDGPARLYAQLAEAAALVFLGDADAAAELARAVAADALGEVADLQLQAYLGMVLAFAEEWEAARRVIADTVAACERSAPGLLPYPLTSQAWLERGTGEWPAAVADLELAIERCRDTGRANDEAWAQSILAWIRAAQGRREQVAAAVDRQSELHGRLDLPYQLMTTDASQGLLALGEGDAAAAAPLLRRALEAKRALGCSDATTRPVITPDLVEALVRVGDRDEAAAVLEPFVGEATRPAAVGLALRCRGLLADDEESDELFAQAVQLHEQAEDPFALGRTLLLHGERLRRGGQRRRARELLDRAAGIFVELGAVPWAARAGEEQGRSARVLRTDEGARDELTPSEHQVASLAVRGLQNRDISQRLFMSTKTVEAHLTRIYKKLGVRTRVELVHAYQPEAE